MNVLLNVFKVTLEEGFMYAILAMGVYITYSILDFPDLSVDGTMPLGAVVTGVLIMHGVNPWLCILISFALGAVAGAVTGVLHIKFKIRDLLCGILVYTSLLTVNLVVVETGTGGMSIASFFRDPTIFNTFPATLIPESVNGFSLRVLAVSLLLALVVKILLRPVPQNQVRLAFEGGGGQFAVCHIACKRPRQEQGARSVPRQRSCGGFRLDYSSGKRFCRHADGRGYGGFGTCLCYNRTEFV